jgi:hypothetical protein
LRKLETTDPKHPDTWNPNYQDLINNDVFLKVFADEVNTARGGKASLATRLTGIEQTQAALDPEFIDALATVVKFSLDQAAVANYGVRALHRFAQQEGSITLTNRGVVSGCVIGKSTNAARNLNISTGVCFAQGRAFSAAGGVNAASVPSNTGSGAVTVYAYLYQDAQSLWRLAVTAIGQALPDGGIVLYNLTVPANSTDATDPNLTNVTLTDRRRLEPNFPILLDNAVQVSPQINALPDADYHITFDVLAATGAPADAMSLQVTSRASNGFTVRLASVADNVTARWRIGRLNA